MLAFLLLANSSIVGQRTAVQAQDPRTEIFNSVNQVRANYGLPPYQWDAMLAAAAQSQAEYMAANNIYSHSGAGGSTPQTRALAAGYAGRANENIVGGTDLTPRQGVTWWINSPTHFNTMISNQYIHAGVGHAVGHGQNFYALVVGVPSDGIAATLPKTNDTLDAPAVRVDPITLTSPNEDGSIIHTVLEGHTFWAIAARYEITIDELFLYNNLNNESTIHPGDTLTIRLADGAEPPPTPTPPATHIIRDGETPWTIAATYRLTLDEFYWLNGIDEYDILHPGNEVKIRLVPGEEPPPTPTPQLAHEVRTGDTLWGISIRYGLGLNDLLAYNGLTENAVLSIGDLLLIVAPTPIPTETPLPTATHPPTATAVPPTITPLPQPTTTLPAVVKRSSNASPTIQPTITADSSTLQKGMSTGAFVLGFGLVALAGIGLIFFRRQ